MSSRNGPDFSQKSEIRLIFSKFSDTSVEMWDIIKDSFESENELTLPERCVSDRFWPDFFTKCSRFAPMGMDGQLSPLNGVVRDLPRKPLKECLFTVKDSGLVLPHDTARKTKQSGNGSRSKVRSAKRNRRSGAWEDATAAAAWTEQQLPTAAAAVSTSAPTSPSMVILRVTPPGSPLSTRVATLNDGNPSSDIHQHLQSMLHLLRSEDTLKMAVKLESAHEGRTRYLAVVAYGEESILLGMDCRILETTSIGLCLRLLADTAITLDGDGGFRVSTAGRNHIFKPVSVQAMWSALQTLHKSCGAARQRNFFFGGGSHEWAKSYESAPVRSDRSCINEWNAMDDLESRRPPSPDSLLSRLRPGVAQRQETEGMIRAKLKEIMMSVDLDQVTSKSIRIRLEREMNFDLADYKSFIDQEMITILGQMDQATEIFSHLYLGSEWNASNLEELQRNGITHILNVTREIDNFFPGIFEYYNVRVYDDEATQLLKYWDDTYKYITRA
ncbi:unnamed protein product, partial [Notodromas monacha]